MQRKTNRSKQLAFALLMKEYLGRSHTRVFVPNTMLPEKIDRSVYRCEDLLLNFQSSESS